MKNLDTAALRQGGAVALVFAVPFSIGARLMADHSAKSPWTSVLWLAALGGFTLGAGIAAWVQTKDLPLLHGMVCAGGTYLIAQAVFVVAKLIRGSDVHWLAVFFTFTAVMFAGMVGGGIGSALRKRGIMPRGGGTA
jgi:peptidoglycan/LPS O-acetylase OafA/YrhL